MSHQPPNLLTFFFFFNDTATTEIYTLSLHDALPIYRHDGHEEGHRDDDAEQGEEGAELVAPRGVEGLQDSFGKLHRDRKSTRLNSSHSQISYAVFCLKKKKSVMLLVRDKHILRPSRD